MCNNYDEQDDTDYLLSLYNKQQKEITKDDILNLINVEGSYFPQFQKLSEKFIREHKDHVDWTPNTHRKLYHY